MPTIKPKNQNKGKCLVHIGKRQNTEMSPKYLLHSAHPSETVFLHSSC